VRFEVFMEVKIGFMIFWVLAQQILIKICMYVSLKYIYINEQW